MADRPEDQERAGVPLARYAEIRAELRVLGRARASEVLAQAGVRPEDWENADAAWRAALDEDEDGRAGFLLVFAARFSEARRRLLRAPDGGGVETAGVVPAPFVMQDPAPDAQASVPTFLLAPPVGVPAPAPSAERSRRALVATGDVDIHAVVANILPFESRASAPRLPDLEAAVATKPRADAKPKAALGETADLDIHHLVSKLMPFGAPAAPMREPSRPPPAAPPAGAPILPDLTLEQYASLTAEMATSPERSAETRAKYGVPTEDAYRALNALWARRFAENAALQDRCVRLVGEYRAWLQQRR